MLTQTQADRTPFLKSEQFERDLIHELHPHLQAILGAVEQLHRSPQLPPDQHLNLILENSRLLFAKAERLHQIKQSATGQRPTAPAGFSRTVNRAPDFPPEECPLLKKLRRIILNHLEDEHFAPQTLCREIGMSRTQLYRKMKELTNYSVAKYIRLVRLHVARELLETTQLSIGQVSFQVGFQDQSYFSKVFLEEFGVRPKKVTKKYLSGQ